MDKIYDLDEIIKRFNIHFMNNFKGKYLNYRGYSEKENISLYERLIYLDIASGLIKTKTFIDYLKKIPDAHVILTINIQKDDDDISYKGKAFPYDQWIENQTNRAYVDMFKEDAFYSSTNDIIKIPLLTNYHAFTCIKKILHRNDDRL